MPIKAASPIHNTEKTNPSSDRIMETKADVSKTNDIINAPNSLSTNNTSYKNIEKTVILLFQTPECSTILLKSKT
jgi:hypothetical protein